MRENLQYSDDIKDLDTIKVELLKLNQNIDKFIFNKCIYQLIELNNLKKEYIFDNINSI